MNKLVLPVKGVRGVSFNKDFVKFRFSSGGFLEYMDKNKFVLHAIKSPYLEEIYKERNLLMHAVVDKVVGICNRINGLSPNTFDIDMNSILASSMSDGNTPYTKELGSKLLSYISQSSVYNPTKLERDLKRYFSQDEIDGILKCLDKETSANRGAFDIHYTGNSCIVSMISFSCGSAGFILNLVAVVISRELAGRDKGYVHKDVNDYVYRLFRLILHGVGSIKEKKEIVNNPMKIVTV